MDDKLRNIKASLTRAEKININKVVIDKVSSFFFKADIIVSPILENILRIFQTKKMNELLDYISEADVVLTEEDFNDVELLMNFRKTLEAVSKLATNDKIHYFANLFTNGYLGDIRISNDEFEEYSYCINIMSKREIDLLYLLYQYEQEYKQKGDYKKPFLEASTIRFNLSSREILAILNRLQSTGFIRNFSSEGMMFINPDTLVYVTTDIFKKFISLITRQEQ